jgi:hypothetical protein
MLFLLQLGQGPKFSGADMVPGIETYRAVVRAIRESSGDDYLQFCSDFLYGEFGLGDAGCTGSDIGNPCFKTGHAADNRIYDLAEFRQNVTSILARHFLHRRLTLQNPDAANLGAEGDLNEARLRFSLVAFSGGQFFLGDDLTRYTEERLALAEKGLPIYGQAAIPLDLFESPVPDSPHVWRLPVTTAWDQWNVFCLSNLADRREATIDLLSFLPGQEENLLFDFWEEQALGRLGGHSRFTLQPLESKILSVRRPRKHPHLLATNMHFTQGGVEVLEHRWEDSSSQLTLALRRRPGAQGTIWVHVPNAFAMSVPILADGARARSVPISPDLLGIEIEFQRRDAAITTPFTAVQRKL